MLNIFKKRKSIDENGKFKSELPKKDRIQEIDVIISHIHMNLGNNYKDEAQRGLKEFHELFTQMKENGILNEKQCLVYGDKLKTLSTEMDGFTHKDQKPYWH